MSGKEFEPFFIISDPELPGQYLVGRLMPRKTRPPRVQIFLATWGINHLNCSELKLTATLRGRQE